MSVDLNALRAAVIANQNRGDALPSDPTKQVVVDREGKVRLGGDIRQGEVATQVPQETFAKER